MVLIVTYKDEVVTHDHVTKIEEHPTIKGAIYIYYGNEEDGVLHRNIMSIQLLPKLLS